MHEALQASTLERVDRHPFECEVIVPQHPAQSWYDALGRLLRVGVSVGSELKVDPPYVVGLLVQKRRAAIMELRVEPEPAFDGEVAAHFHVGNQEAVLESLALKVELEHPPNR